MESFEALCGDAERVRNGYPDASSTDIETKDTLGVFLHEGDYMRREVGSPDLRPRTLGFRLSHPGPRSSGKLCAPFPKCLRMSCRSDARWTHPFGPSHGVSFGPSEAEAGRLKPI